MIKLGLALKVFNLVTKFEKKSFTFVAVIVRKRSVTDRQTEINHPPFFSSKKRGIKMKTEGENTYCNGFSCIYFSLKIGNVIQESITYTHSYLFSKLLL